MGGVAFVLCFPKTGFVAAASSTVNANAIVTVHLPPDADILDDFDDTDDQNFWDGGNGVMEEVAGNKSITRSFEWAGGPTGTSLKLSYNLNTSSTWNGFFMNLNNDVAVTKNISGYR